MPTNSTLPELELYPINIKFLRHVSQNNRQQVNNWSGMVGGYGASAIGKVLTQRFVGFTIIFYFTNLFYSKGIQDMLMSQI